MKHKRVFSQMFADLQQQLSQIQDFVTIHSEQSSPSLQMYHGQTGIKTLHHEFLSEAKRAGEPILAIDSGFSTKAHKSLLTKYHQDRINAHLIAYIICADDPTGRAYKWKYDSCYSLFKLVNGFSVAANISVVGDVIMTFTLSPLQGTLIRNPAEAATWKNFYQSMWKRL